MTLSHATVQQSVLGIMSEGMCLAHKCSDDLLILRNLHGSYEYLWLVIIWGCSAVKTRWDCACLTWLVFKRDTVVRPNLQGIICDLAPSAGAEPSLQVTREQIQMKFIRTDQVFLKKKCCLSSCLGRRVHIHFPHKNIPCLFWHLNWWPSVSVFPSCWINGFNSLAALTWIWQETCRSYTLKYQTPAT